MKSNEKTMEIFDQAQKMLIEKKPFNQSKWAKIMDYLSSAHPLFGEEDLNIKKENKLKEENKVKEEMKLEKQIEYLSLENK